MTSLQARLSAGLILVLALLMVLAGTLAIVMAVGGALVPMALLVGIILLAVGLFLYLNGLRLQASQVDATVTMLAVAAGDMPEEAFAAWLRAHSVARA